MEIIVPAAGLSSRFPGMKPKFLLYDYLGSMMLVNSLRPYIGKHSINVAILKQHDEEYSASEFIRNEIPGAHILILPEPTTGPADTVATIIRNFDIKGEILIKDCDAFFNHADAPGNFVCVSRIPNHETLHKLSSKSFVVANNNGIIQDIIEKKVISDTFCVGGYKFESAETFVECFDDVKMLRNGSAEVFVSHVISQAMYAKQERFLCNNVSDYVDVGTAEDWFAFNDRPVIFSDVDGTIIHSQGRYGKNNYQSPPIVLKENVKRLLAYKARGSQIIFTTARPPDTVDRTKQILEELGFRDCPLIAGLNNSRRILINDFNSSNPFPRAEAINIRRNTDEISDFLGMPRD